MWRRFGCGMLWGMFELREDLFGLVFVGGWR
jgi:hypothetical protein